MFLKKSIIITIFIICFTSKVFSQANSEGKANVYFLRATGLSGLLIGFNAFIDDSLVCKLNNNRYSVHEIPAGEHTFSVQFAGKKSKKKAERIKIEVEAGKTYYIQMIIQISFVNNIYCQEITENSSKIIMPLLKEDDKCL